MEEKEDLRTYLANAPVFVRLDDGEIILWTAGARQLYGYTEAEAVGAISHELLCTEFPEPLSVIIDCLNRFGSWQGELLHRHADGHRLTMKSFWRRTISAVSRRPVVIETNADVSDRVAAERRQTLLTDELRHRVKNIISVVQSLAHMSFRDLPYDALAPFEDRLIALARAHDVLLESAWQDADLRTVVERVIKVFHAGPQVRLCGPEVALTPVAAVAYSLAFHELCTNAVKYGALSHSGGRIEVAWTLLGPNDDRIHLVWRERGGPPVAPPIREGFGTRLLKRALAVELGSPVVLRYEPEGLVCEFDGKVQKQPAPDVAAHLEL